MNPEYVIAAVCVHTGVDRAELMSERRGPRVVMAREVCAYMLREHCHLSYPDITRAVRGLGDMVPTASVSHQTLMYSHKRIAAVMAGDGMRTYYSGMSDPKPVNIREMIQTLEVTLGLAKGAA